MENNKNNNNNNDSSSSKLNYRMLTPLALVGLIDAISFMVVAPSIVFYVYSLGGTKEQYGLILSSFSFASFCFKPVLGHWCDQSGGKFRLPYLVSNAVAIAGGIFYFLASCFASSTATSSATSTPRVSVAVALVFISRVLGGIGAANSTLAFTYVAQVIPNQHMTKANALLSMVRVFGMAAAPALNAILNACQGNIAIIGTSWSVSITPLNSVGLFLAATNTLSFIVLYCMLEEPPHAPTDNDKFDDEDDDDVNYNSGDNWSTSHHSGNRQWQFLQSMLLLDITVPIFCIFAMNANFQLMETGMAPVASDALGMGPVGISAVFGVNAILIFFVILLTFQLSAAGVHDSALLMCGLVSSTIGYLTMYFLWAANTTLWRFYIPIVFATMAFPFMGAPTRSLFTKSVASSAILRSHQGTMQAILSMAASIAGFAAPGLIAAFVLRTPEQVATSQDHREFSPWALFAPVLSIVCLIGVLCLRCSETEEEIMEEEPMVVDETTALVSPSSAPYVTPIFFSPTTEAHRRNTITIMGIPQFDYHKEAAKRSRHSVAF